MSSDPVVLSLSEQVRELIGAVRTKITVLTKELADARAELRSARAALIVPRKSRAAKPAGKGKPKNKPAPAAAGE